MWFSSFEVLTVKHHLLKTLLLVSSLTWVGTAIAQTDNRPTVRVAVQQVANSGTLTPLREQSNVGSRSFPMIYAGLIELDRQGDLSLKPGLATSWKRIDDFTVELKLRKGVKFHNGDEMTADDVAFTFGPEYMFGSTKPLVVGQVAATIATTTNQTPATAVKLPAATLPPEVPAVARRMWPSLAQVKVIDKYTVRFINLAPDLTLEGRLARSSEIISKRAFLEAKDWASWARSPVAAGPFKIKEFKPDNSLVLTAHDAYFGGKPNVKEVRYQVVPEVSGRVNGLLSGEYDFVTDIPPDQIKTIEANPKFEVVGGPVLNHRIIVFDKNHPQMANPKIRVAMAHAIDRDAIVKSLWGNRTSVPAGLQWEYYGPMFQKNWSVPKYDPALAAPFNDPVSSIVNQHGPNGQQQQMGEWRNSEFNTLSTLLETSTNMDNRSRAFRRMLEIAEREDPAYTVLHRNVVFYGKRKDIQWKWSPTFTMDFRAANLTMPVSGK